MTAIAIYERPRTGTVKGEQHGSTQTRNCVILGWVVEGAEIKALVCDEGEYGSNMGNRTRAVDANKVIVYYGNDD